MALCFKYVYRDDYLNIDVLTENLKHLYKIFHDNIDYDINQYYKRVIFLLTNNEYLTNDLNISELDFNLYQDILLYQQPLVYFDNKYTCHHDEEGLSLINFGRSTLPIEYIQKNLLNLLHSFEDRIDIFNTEHFKFLYLNKINKFYNKYYRLNKS